MKVKIFADKSITELEKNINGFVENKILCDVKLSVNCGVKYAVVTYSDLFTVEDVPVEDAGYILLKEEKTNV